MSCFDYKSVLKKNQTNLNDLLSDINNLINNSKHSEKAFCSSESKILKHFSLINSLNSIQNSNENVKFSVDKNFEFITIILEDFDKSHELKLKSTPSGNCVSHSHSLPELDHLQCEFTDIQQAVQIFKESVSDLSEYFDTMSDLDSCCWIIDPSLPTSKDNFRRIVIGDNVSILVTVDYQNSRDMPHVCVLGPSAAVELFSNKIHEYADKWNADLNITINLLNMLDIPEFPSKPLINDSCGMEEASEIDCGICFSVRDESGTLPNIICENLNCSQNFHMGCLYQWLSAISANIQTFDTIHGECPSCMSSISCAVVDNY